MKLPVLLTILALAFGYVCLILPEATAPFLAVFLIYFVWKIDDFKEANKKMQKELDEIKSRLQQQNETSTSANSEEAQPNVAAETHQNDEL